MNISHGGDKKTFPIKDSERKLVVITSHLSTRRQAPKPTWYKLGGRCWELEASSSSVVEILQSSFLLLILQQKYSNL